MSSLSKELLVKSKPKPSKMLPLQTFHFLIIMKTLHPQICEFKGIEKQISNDFFYFIFINCSINIGLTLDKFEVNMLAFCQRSKRTHERSEIF